MSSRKYAVINVREAREVLTSEWMGALDHIITTINNARAQKVPPKPQSVYYVLNMADKYALPAVESYIQAVDDDQNNNHQDGVKAARAVAMSCREFAITRTSGEKTPT